MTFRKKMALPLAAACMVLGLMVVAQSATADHPRPKGASPFRASLDIAYESCPTQLVQAPNSTHAAPLSVPSCADAPPNNDPISPGGGGGPQGPEQSSPYLTSGEPTLTPPHAAVANLIGYVQLIGATPLGDVITSEIQDVRCRSLAHSEQVPGGLAGPTPPASLPCGAPGSNTTAGADYLGELEGSVQLQITDHASTPGSVNTPPGPATVERFLMKFPFPPGSCAVTGPGVGATCTTTTTTNAQCGCVPVIATKNLNIEFTSPIEINDGGPDGDVDTAPLDNSVYLRQGIFIP